MLRSNGDGNFLPEPVAAVTDLVFTHIFSGVSQVAANDDFVAMG
jgi:hypothetical protein